jgi:hypothetical protein
LYDPIVRKHRARAILPAMEILDRDLLAGRKAAPQKVVESLGFPAD